VTGHLATRHREIATHSHRRGGLSACREMYEVTDPTFRCPRCGKLRGWCQGSSDSQECDICWDKKRRAQERNGSQW
jgi:hypothetical protein